MKKEKIKFTKEDRKEMKAVSKMFGTIRFIAGNPRGFLTTYYSKPEDERKKVIEHFTNFEEELGR